MKIYLSLILVFFALNYSTGDSTNDKIFQIDFYGHSIELNYMENIIDLDENISVEAFKRSYDILANSDNFNLINQLSNYRNKFSLDDFGYFILAKKSIEKIFVNKSELFKTLFIWFILDSQDYDVYLGYNDVGVRVYAPLNIDSVIGSVSYKQIDGKKYYDLSFSLPPLLKSYKYKYEGSVNNSKIIELDFKNHPKINAKITKRQLRLFYNRLIILDFEVNESLTQYYDDLPMMSPSRVHKNYKISEAAGGLVNELKRITDTMTSEDGLNLILSLCQYSIYYEADQELFGKEKTLFAEQLLSIGKGDCEDKSILFSCLVSELFPFKTVIFIYTGHANVGVCFEKDGGDYIKFNKYTYLVCDPSFEGYKIGETKIKEKIISVVE